MSESVPSICVFRSLLSPNFLEATLEILLGAIQALITL